VIGYRVMWGAQIVDPQTGGAYAIMTSSQDEPLNATSANINIPNDGATYYVIVVAINSRSDNEMSGDLVFVIE